MKKHLLFSVVAVIATAGIVSVVMANKLVFAAPVSVFNQEACGGDTSICGSSDGTELLSVIMVIINTMIFVAGIIAVIMIIVGGIKYATSAGDTNQITGAKNTILYSVVGLVVAIMSFAIVNFVLDQFVDLGGSSGDSSSESSSGDSSSESSSGDSSSDGGADSDSDSGSNEGDIPVPGRGSGTGTSPSPDTGSDGSSTSPRSPQPRVPNPRLPRN